MCLPNEELLIDHRKDMAAKYKMSEYQLTLHTFLQKKKKKKKKKTSITAKQRILKW